MDEPSRRKRQHEGNQIAEETSAQRGGDQRRQRNDPGYQQPALVLSVETVEFFFEFFDVRHGSELAQSPRLLINPSVSP